jgi:hypothetical protein
MVPKSGKRAPLTGKRAVQVREYLWVRGMIGDHLIDREDRASLGAPGCRTEWDAFHGVCAVFDFGSDALIGFQFQDRFYPESMALWLKGLV